MAEYDVNQKLHFEVWIADAVAHLFKVRLTISCARENQRLSLPQWIPGSYMIRHFARHIIELNAQDEQGKNLPIEKLNGHQWRLNNQAGKITLEYQVYAWDLSVRGAHLDQTHGFFNGTSLFLEPEGFSDVRCVLTLHQPEMPFAKNWRVATSMPAANSINKPDEYGFGEFECEDYQALIDHPVEMGELTIEAFDVKGIPHEIAFYGRHNADTKRIVNDLIPICERQIELFGKLPDCVDKYVFLVTVLGDGYGGLEHRSSTALHCSRKDLPQVGESEVSDDYINFLTLCSHEYFHTWNIKQIKPAQFLPYDLSKETYTQQLWIFEGFTSYYEDRLVYQAGVIDREQYLKCLAQVITRVHRGKGRTLQSAAESSFDAWTRFYMQDQNAPNAIVSYYAKGKLIALCLDLLIREQTGNEQSLDHVMQLLWRNYGAVQKGLNEKELEKILRNEFKLELDGFIQSAVYSTDELPLDELLSKAGVKLSWNTVSRYKELVSSESKTDVNLGALIKPHPSGAEVNVVYHDSNAYRAGLSTGDVIIAVNGLKVDASNLESMIASLQPEQECTIHSFRRDELMVSNFVLTTARPDTCSLSVNSDSTPAIEWL